MMLLVELVSIFIMALVLMKLKSKFPNIFFPPTNVNVYLPPVAEDNAAKKTKTALQIQCLKSNAETFYSVPFTQELETIVLFFMIIAGQYLLVELLNLISTFYYGEQFQNSGMLFYFASITLVIMIGNLFKAATLGGLQGYETRMAILISILCTITILVVFYGFRDFIDINIRHEIQRQQVHSNIIFQDVLQFFWIERFQDLFIVVLALPISFLIFCFVPVIIRFGNCWTEFKNPQFDDQIIIEQPTFILMTFQLLLPLPIIVLNIYTFTRSLPSYVTPLFLQCLFLLVLTFLQTITYKVEMDRHMYKGYLWAKILVDQPQLIIPIQKRIAGLFKGMVVVSYQLLAKIAIPLLLMIILQQKSQALSRNLDYSGQYLQKDIFCYKNNATIMEVLRGFGDTCQDISIFTVTPFGLPKQMMRRMQQYGLMSETFIYTLVQFFFFNYMLLTFALNIFYIFFVNKTQTVGATYKFNQDSPQKTKEIKKELKKEQKKQIKA